MRRPVRRKPEGLEVFGIRRRCLKGAEGFWREHVPIHVSQAIRALVTWEEDVDASVVIPPSALANLLEVHLRCSQLVC